MMYWAYWEDGGVESCNYYIYPVCSFGEPMLKGGVYIVDLLMAGEKSYV